MTVSPWARLAAGLVRAHAAGVLHRAYGHDAAVLCDPAGAVRQQSETETLCRLGQLSEKDTKLAQTLGQLQPLIAVFSQEYTGQVLASFGPT
jgi:hypothetical protein